MANWLRQVCKSRNTLFWRSFSSDTNKPLFKKLLIANRGEITCRVIETCRKMGIPTVAIYSEPDAKAKHVLMADEAVEIGPAASSESYLVIDKIMKVIADTGADAVHPGYGFLSENEEFSQRLSDAGVSFVGPGPFAIRSMGDKIESMRIAEQAGVSCAKRFDGEVKTVEHAQSIANELGYPVIMKASAGGGGKGMRIAWSEKELLEGFQLARDEAASSFGDDRMLIQQFVCPYESRHIEIQIVADQHGNVATFPERECSIQRRNQKVVEESPSILMNEQTRQTMQEQAALLCRSVGYASAGTVEFIADNEQNFYFLEMNTRLQVEHPVTEEITGVDLVELMIRVAAGEKLPDHLLPDPDTGRYGVPFNGWSLESRVYAEDPLRGFLPSIGFLKQYVEPPVSADSPLASYVGLDSEHKVRVDSGVLEGSEISMFYDPMICKLITKAPTRESAVALMDRALSTYVIRGLNHNVAFCRELCKHPKFMVGDISTDFIKDEYPDGFETPSLRPSEEREVVAAALYMFNQIEGDVQSGDATEMFYSTGLPGAQAVASERSRVALQNGGDGSFAVAFDDCDTELSSVSWDGAHVPLLHASFSAGGDSASRIAVQYVERLNQGVRVSYGGSNYDISFLTKRENDLSEFMVPKVEADMSKSLLSPMPGTLISLAVDVGQTVEPGQELAVVEAMKMQNILRAEKKGVVKSIPSEPGNKLNVDQLILNFE